MQYLPEQNVVVMTLSDLEHCGFDYEEFNKELYFSGCEAANWPIALLVNFAGGYVVSPNTPPGHLRRYEKANEKFEIILEAVKGMDVVSYE